MGKKKAAVKQKGFEVLQSLGPVGFLIAPETTETFWTSTWEKAPKLFKATEERKWLFTGVSDLNAIERWMQTEQDKVPIQFGIDLVAAKYTDGVRTTTSPDGEVATVAGVRKLYRDGATLQLHQPQRFDDVLWRLMAPMESTLGCLVGCNAYLTPAGTQGLAPHHDDVEIWVCQTRGSKRWRVYRPVNGFQLPNRSSPDLSQQELGEPLMDIVLEVGDVLYLPRGTVHQAEAQKSESAHVTLSTYQRWTQGELAVHAIQAMLEGQSEPLCAPLEMRRGLTPGLVLSAGTHGNLLRGLHTSAPSAAPNGGSAANLKADSAPGVSDATAAAASALAQALRAAADRLEQRPQLLLPAVDSLALDFLAGRLPPHPDALPPAGPAPTMKDALYCRGEGLFVVMPVTAAPPNPEEPGGLVQLCTCIPNRRETHMMPDDQWGDSSSDDDGEEHDDDGCCGGHEHHHHHHDEQHAGADGDQLGLQAGGVKHRAKSGGKADEQGAQGDAGDDKAKPLGGEDKGRQQGDKAEDDMEAEESEDVEEDEEGEEAQLGDDEDKSERKKGKTAQTKDGKAQNGSSKGSKASAEGKKGGEEGGSSEEEEEEEGEDTGDEEEDSDEEGGNDDDPLAAVPGVVFPARYSAALAQVLSAHGPPGVRVEDLKIGSRTERLKLAFALWAEGVACCVKQEQPQREQQGSGSAAKPRKRRRADS